MKNIPFFDILFIIITACVITLVTYFGYLKILSQFSIIFAMAAYFIGKYVGRTELRKKLNAGNNQ